MRRYDKAYAASHREERREAARRWQARFKAEHGISYSAWRRRRLRETDPQAAASTPSTGRAREEHGRERAGGGRQQHQVSQHRVGGTPQVRPAPVTPRLTASRPR